MNDEIPVYSIVIGDFDARYSKWWRNDIAKFAGKEIDFQTSLAGYAKSFTNPLMS